MSSESTPPGGPPPSDDQQDAPGTSSPPRTASGADHGQPQPWQPPNANRTPNAEKYLLEADALRRRQLRSALLHGSRRTWRDQTRTWPAIVAGIVVVAVILAAFKVTIAVRETENTSPPTGPPTVISTPTGGSLPTTAGTPTVNAPGLTGPPASVTRGSKSHH